MNTDSVARPLHTFERRGPTRTFDVDGWTLLRDFSTVLFGDGGSLKSFLALYVAGRLAQQGTRVLLLDWELDGEDHRERLHRLFGADVPTDVYYLRAEGPLVSEADVLTREVKRLGVQYLICDSVGLATDGPPEASEQALNYFRALRKLGVRGSLQIAHTTKNGDAADQRPFGSVYWHHLARMTWFAKRETSSPERPCVRLVNRKTNLTAALSDVRLQFDFGADRTIVSRIADSDESVETGTDGPLSLRHQIAGLLKARAGQPLTVSEIAVALDAKAETVARKVRQYPNLFVRLSTSGDGPRIGLVERRPV